MCSQMVTFYHVTYIKRLDNVQHEFIHLLYISNHSFTVNRAFVQLDRLGKPYCYGLNCRPTVCLTPCSITFAFFFQYSLIFEVLQRVSHTQPSQMEIYFESCLYFMSQYFWVLNVKVFLIVGMVCHIRAVQFLKVFYPSGLSACIIKYECTMFVIYNVSKVVAIASH